MLTSRVLFFVTVALLSALSPARAAGEAPIAEAGVGLLARVGDTVVLNGSGSYDPEGDAIVYVWTQVGGPPVTLRKDDSPKPEFEVESAGTLRFELVVSDDLTASAPDTVEVVVPFEAIAGVETGCATPPAGAGIAGVLLAALAVRRRAHGHRSR